MTRLLPFLLLACSTVVAAADRVERERLQPPPGATTSRLPPNVGFTGGDGSDCDRAVVIRGSKGARDIVASEIAWLQARYPGYKFRDTTVETRGGRTFEQVSIDTAAGESKVFCFDITEGFGNL